MAKLKELQTKQKSVGDVRTGGSLMTALELVSDRETKAPINKAIAGRVRVLACPVGVMARVSGPNIILSLPLVPRMAEATQMAYFDDFNQEIGEQTFSIGEVRFGPNFSYDAIRDDGSIVRPSAGVTGVWNSDVESGASTAADTLGIDDYESRGGSVKLSVTLGSGPIKYWDSQSV